MTRTAALALLVLCALSAACAAAEPDGLIPSPEAGWPQWKGPRRDGASDETGLLQSWPEGGPPRVWTASGLGRGWSSPIIVGDAIYLSGDFDGECRVISLARDGKPRWQTPNGAPWTRNYPGARAACTFSEGRVYHMNGHGRVACYDAATGREAWAVDTAERFGGPALTWGHAEGLLVDGPRVIVTPGGPKTFMAALDKTTGATVWTSPPLPGDASRENSCSYASPILVRWGGRRLIITGSLQGAVCVDADSGRLQWTFPKRTKYDAACATPAWWAGGVFYTVPSGSGAAFLRLVPPAGPDAPVGFEKAWEHPVDNISGGAVAVGGRIYCAGQQNSGWVALDAADGRELYNTKDLEQGCVLYADARLYCLGERGHMRLVKAGPAFEVAGAFDLTDGKKPDAWTHPVILDGRLYLRYHENLYCHDVSAPKGDAR